VKETTPSLTVASAVIAVADVVVPFETVPDKVSAFAQTVANNEINKRVSFFIFLKIRKLIKYKN
jgi:hypothetical protein